VSVITPDRYSGSEARRSTRVESAVPLLILGRNTMGEAFQERTSSISLNLQGCRYASRHDYPVGSWISLQVLELNGEAKTPLLRAQVRSIHPPRNPRELQQVGVELEISSNVWGLAAPPDDWHRMPRSNVSTMPLASGGVPAREPVTNTTAFPSPAKPEVVHRSGDVAAFPAHPTAVRPEAPKEPAAPRPERVVITSDQLVSAVQGKLQQAAERAVQTALAHQMDEAVKKSLAHIDDYCRTSARQMQEFSAQRVEASARSTEEAILQRLDAQLQQAQQHWESEQQAYRGRAEEISQRIDKIAADAESSLAETRKFIERVARELEPRIHARIDETIGKVSEGLEANAALISDRHLVRLTEDKQRLTREANSQLEARAAEATAGIQRMAGEALNEFRRQLEVQAELAASETHQRVSSSLASLDAESRAACEARRKALESDVARAAEQSTDQFRKGIKAFLYSCLVAAVSAVDEHAQTTLDGLKDSGKVLNEVGDETDTPKKDEPLF
jgi:hypothetical protein